jgi:hypothetical protein
MLPDDVREMAERLKRVYAGEAPSSVYGDRDVEVGKLKLARDAAMEAGRRMDAERREWLPIEQAPKDGTRILVWFEASGGPAVTIASWSRVADRWMTYGFTLVGDPDGWQPLPAPPAGERE